MIKIICKKIESKRTSKKLFWKTLINIKDVFWRIKEEIIYLGFIFTRNERDLNGIIKGKRILIIGSQKTAMEIKSIPKDIVILACNNTPLVLLRKKINKKIDIYLGGGHVYEKSEKIARRIYSDLSVDLYLIKGNYKIPFYTSNNFHPLKYNKIIHIESFFRYIKKKFSQKNKIRFSFIGKKQYLSSGLWLLLFSIYFNAKEIYLIGMDFRDDKHWYEDKINVMSDYNLIHREIDNKFLKLVSKKYNNIYSASKNSPIIKYFKYKMLK